MGGRAARRGASTGMALSAFLVLCLLVMQPALCKSRPGISSEEVLSRLTQFTVSGANASSSVSVASSDLPSGKYRLHECEKFLDVPAVKGPQRQCSGKLYTEWSQASILVYKPKDVRGLVKAAAARKVKEILAFETMAPKPNDDLISALSGPNHFIVFSSKEVDAAHAFNKLGQMANSDLLVMVLGGQEDALSAALDGKVLNLFKKDRDLALLTTSASIALGGGEGADFTPQRVKTEVKAALFGPLIARRTAFMDSGMFHAGLSNDCLQLNAADLSLRLRNLGHSVSAYVTASSADGGDAPNAASLSKLGTQGCSVLGRESAYEKSEGRKLCYRAEDFHQNPAPSGSLIVQYFKRSANIKDIVESFKGYKTRAKLIINDDSRSEYADWAAALRDWNKGFLVYSPNVHEIRAYNRLTQFADSETVVYLQDDDLGAENLDWLGKAKKLFANHADLALLGGFRGRMDFGTVMDSKKHLIQGPKFGVPSSNPRCCFKIPWKDPKSGVPFMFVYKVNMGPMMAKRSLFLKLGMYHPGFSCAGDPGIGKTLSLSLSLALLWLSSRDDGAL